MRDAALIKIAGPYGTTCVLETYASCVALTTPHLVSDIRDTSRALLPPAAPHLPQGRAVGGHVNVGNTWREQQEKAIASLKNEGCDYAGQATWTSHPKRRPALRGLTGTPRQTALVNHALRSWCWARRLDPAALLVGDLFLDISQCVSRRPWGSTIRALTSSTSIYSFRHDRLLVPEELMQVYGWPRPSRVLGASEAAQLADLVSECMPLPSLAVPLFSLLAALGTALPGLWQGGR